MTIIINEKQFEEIAFILAKIGCNIEGKKIAHHKSPSTDD